MGRIRTPERVKFFCGVLHADGEDWPALRDALSGRFGELESCSGAIPFEFTDYYRQELGEHVWRRFVALRELGDPARLADLKLGANRLEGELAAASLTGLPRPVNLDPGYLESSKLVLASTKNFAHRVYLRDGGWGEVTLCFRGGRWEAFPWTFADYRSEAYQSYFLGLRECYRRQLRPGDR